MTYFRQVTRHFEGAASVRGVATTEPVAERTKDRCRASEIAGLSSLSHRGRHAFVLGRRANGALAIALRVNGLRQIHRRRRDGELATHCGNLARWH